MLITQPQQPVKDRFMTTTRVRNTLNRIDYMKDNQSQSWRIEQIFCRCRSLVVVTVTIQEFCLIRQWNELCAKPAEMNDQIGSWLDTPHLITREKNVLNHYFH